MLAVSACGVPTSGPPIADGPPPAGGSSANGGIPPPPGPDVETTNADDFVQDYLEAVAGASTLDGQTAAARAYMNADALGAWGKPDANGQVNVLRQIGGWRPDSTRTASDGSTVIDVTGTFEIVGELVVTTGELQPPAASRTSAAGDRRTLTFSVGDSETGPGRFRLTDGVPPGLYLSEPALIHWFAPHPVYFWDPNHQALIPDIRYVPLVLSGIQQATQVVNWALGSPSHWIDGAALSLGAASNASLVDPTISVTGDGTYVVNLSTSAHAVQPAALLAYQLRWSLGTLTVGTGEAPMPVDVEIEGQSQVISSDNSFREHVPNLAPSRSSVEASAYAIAGGKAIQVAIDPATEYIAQIGASGQPRVLNSPKNTNVVAAAVDGSASAAALVRADSRGDTLWIRRTGNTASDFAEVKDLAGHVMSRPQFVTQPAGAVVVAVDGQLKLVDAGRHFQTIALPSGISTISAFSIAPDAHRIAFISGGRLYFSVLSVITATDPPTMTAALPIVIGPSLTTATTVAWSSTTQLVVGGQDGATGKIAEVNVDGSLDPGQFAREYGPTKITQVAAYAYDPLPQPGFDEVMVQTGQGVIAGRTGGKKVALTAPFFQD
jgi:Lipoprotein LpqB beta-propeller domain